MARAKNPSLYRALHKLRKGGLHRALHVPEGETIPKSKVEAATHSKNAHVAKMANFAQTMSGFKH
jgi:DNA-binding PadR family transcriptional regulator